MTDCFVAKVVGAGTAANTWTVTPLMTEHDGTDHPDILVASTSGITCLPGDLVLVLTARNNIDDSSVPRWFEASEACGRIIAISKSKDGIFRFTGDHTFIINGMMLNITANPISSLPDIIQQTTQRTAFSDNFLTPLGPCISRIPGGLP